MASFRLVPYWRRMIERSLLKLTAAVVVATVENNRIPNNDLASLVSSVYHALAKLPAPTAAETVEAPVPAVSVRSSVKPDSITCLECGAVQKALRRHLGTSHDLTPEQYRAKWKLGADYPMTAPNTSAERSRASIARGFGRRS